MPRMAIGRRRRIPSRLERSASSWNGGIAQLGERLLCKQEVIGSIPFASTSEFLLPARRARWAVSLIRLLFKNSEEVKRIRFSQTGFVWVVIALRAPGFVGSALAKRFL